MEEFINSKGRGTISQPGNRFEELSVELDPAAFEELASVDPDFSPSRPETQCFNDDTKSIISKNASPDLGFTYSLNPYRGCEHGCAYCYARPYHEYLGFNAGIDFETKLMVKKNAPDLLERELARPAWIPHSLACSGVTDCYQPIERTYEITRECLRVLRDFRNPVGIVTKNSLVTRDIDHLVDLAHYNASVVAISLTSLDRDVAGKLEPRASRPEARLKAIKQLSEAGVPVGISLAPVIPGINDHEIPAILEAAKDHGARFAGYTVVRLPYGVKEIFEGWLDQHFPGKKDLILGYGWLIRSSGTIYGMSDSEKSELLPYPANFEEFIEQFAHESDCEEYLEKIRWPDGFQCPECESRDAWKTERSLWHCRRCSRQTSVKIGTVFEATRKPLRLWFHVA